MSDHYHGEHDLQLLKQMKDLAPEDFAAWLNLNNIVGRENGAIPKKYRADSAGGGVHYSMPVLHRGPLESGQSGRCDS